MKRSYRRARSRVMAVAAAVALGSVGLMTVAAGTASASTITENFAAQIALTGTYEVQQLPETINQAATVTQGNNLTISVSGGVQSIPTTQSGVTLNYISGLNTIVPVPANATYVSSSSGNWSFTDASGTTTTGPMTLTECTNSTAAGCTASATSSSFLGATSTPYLEESTGAAQFTGGGTLTLPTWSFVVTATGSGSIVSTVSEAQQTANVVAIGTVSLASYPSVYPTGGCPSTGCTAQPAYAYQPIATTTILSPPAAPVLAPQTGSASAGQCTSINPLTGSTDSGSGDAANPATVVVATQPTHGTATVDTTTGVITYCNTAGTTGATDTFTVTAADTLASPALVSAPVTETIDISYNQCSAGSGSSTGGSTAALSTCSLSQAVVLPVTAGQIVMSQANGLPSDALGSALCTGGTTPGITLNGQEQNACGIVSPVTVTNATGLDSGWQVTGQVTDFNDPADPTLTCDTVATYSNHCIPGDNLGWVPASAVTQSIVPGDTAAVTSGSTVLPPTAVAPNATNLSAQDAAILGEPTQGNPVVESPINAGLHAGPQVLCSTLSGQAGGTFVCGAGLDLAIPASVAEPTVGAYGAAYVATLTLTLS